MAKKSVPNLLENMASVEAFAAEQAAAAVAESDDAPKKAAKKPAKASAVARGPGRPRKSGARKSVQPVLMVTGAIPRGAPKTSSFAVHLPPDVVDLMDTHIVGQRNAVMAYLLRYAVTQLASTSDTGSVRVVGYDDPIE